MKKSATRPTGVLEKMTDTDREALFVRLGLGEKTKHLLRIPDKEAGACAILRLLLCTEKLAEVWELPAIVRWEQEFAFPRGRADFVLFHIDGSVSIVEVKPAGSDRDVLCGIGQLSLYAMQAGFGLRNTEIRRVLALADSFSRNKHNEEACKLAGVRLECLGPLNAHQIGMSEFMFALQEVDHGTE